MTTALWAAWAVSWVGGALCGMTGAFADASGDAVGMGVWYARGHALLMASTLFGGLAVILG